jgi:hypothetical protein
MEVFPFMFYHPFEPVGPYFEDNYASFLSDFVENVGIGLFKLCQSGMSYSVSFRLR